MEYGPGLTRSVELSEVNRLAVLNEVVAVFVASKSVVFHIEALLAAKVMFVK